MVPAVPSGMGGGRGDAKHRRGGGVRACTRGSSEARGGMNGAKRVNGVFNIAIIL